MPATQSLGARTTAWWSNSPSEAPSAAITDHQEVCSRSVIFLSFCRGGRIISQDRMNNTPKNERAVVSGRALPPLLITSHYSSPPHHLILLLLLPGVLLVILLLVRPHRRYNAVFLSVGPCPPSCARCARCQDRDRFLLARALEGTRSAGCAADSCSMGDSLRALLLAAQPPATTTTNATTAAGGGGLAASAAGPAAATEEGEETIKSPRAMNETAATTTTGAGARDDRETTGVS